MKRLLFSLLLLGLLSGPAAAQDQKVTRTWAIAEFGEPMYGPDMPHWPYANPEAPKGGRVVLGAFGTYDSLNTYILRGQWPAGIGLIGDSLMVGSGDELVSAYGLIAETVEYPDDKSWMVFNLRGQARWHDGKPITADDFVFSFDTIRQHGRPFLKSFYDDIDQVTALDERRLKVTFKTRNTMKPLMAAAGLSPLPRHWWTQPGRDITQTTLEPILGSGAYRIKAMDPGRAITYERVKDYWAADLPVSRGMNNFDEIRYDYYLDDTVMFEAFLAGRIDFRQENRAQRWAAGYDTGEVKAGRIVKRDPPDKSPRGTYGYIFNTRRPQFQDARVRRALNHLYDFESIQRTLLYGQYRRIESWFPNSEYGAQGRPTPEEAAILAPYKDKVPPEALTEDFTPPVNDGNRLDRENIRKATALFKEAGWEVRGGKLTKTDTGEVFRLEFLLSNPTLERVTAPYVQILRRAGIDAAIRVVDTAQYDVRTDDYDYDVVMVALNFFPPPGTELRGFFHSAVADVRGQGNFAGIKDPVVDELIEKIIQGKDLPTIEATTRALDRALLWGWYQVPLYYNDVSWLAFWNKFAWPERMAKYSHGFPATWWVDPRKTAALGR